MLTSPEASASSAPIIFPVSNRDAAVDGPTNVGRKCVAAIPKNGTSFYRLSYSKLHWSFDMFYLYRYYLG